MARRALEKAELEQQQKEYDELTKQGQEILYNQVDTLWEGGWTKVKMRGELLEWQAELFGKGPT